MFKNPDQPYKGNKGAQPMVCVGGVAISEFDQ